MVRIKEIGYGLFLVAIICLPILFFSSIISQTISRDQKPIEIGEITDKFLRKGTYGDDVDLMVEINHGNQYKIASVNNYNAFEIGDNVSVHKSFFTYEFYLKKVFEQ